MMNSLRMFVKGLTRATALAMLVACGTMTLPALDVGVRPAMAGMAFVEPFKAGDVITLVLRDGRTIEGVLVSQNDSEYVIEQKMAVGKVKMTYLMGDVLSATKKADAAAPADKPADNTTPPTAGSGEKKDAGAKQPVDPNAATIYVISMKGEFGRDVSQTPLHAIFTDARKLQPDYLVVRVDCNYEFAGQEQADYDPTGGLKAFYGLEKAAQLATILTDEVRDDSKWTKKPKLIMWVKKAMGPAAFLPFVSPDIYYTTDALHGGLGYLDFLNAGRGDEVVREKMRGLLKGRAEGLAVKGGHDPRLIRAMARVDYVLSVSFVGGEPVFFEDMSGDELLTDDGNEEAGRRDTAAQVMRFEGNDVLTLNGQMAFRLRLSKGTVDTMDQLAFELGVSRAYRVLEGKADKILSQWSRDVSAAERELTNLWREFQRTPIEGNTPEERNKGRGKRINILNEMKQIMKKYGEAVSPRNVKAPTNEADLNILIEQLQQEIRLDKPKSPGKR